MTDPFSVIEGSRWLGPIAAVVAGILLGGSPLAWPILATATGLRAGARANEPGRASWAPVLGLGLGITAVYAVLGAAAGSLDAFVRDGLGAWSGVADLGIAVVAAVLGILLLTRTGEACHRWLATPRRGGAGALLLGVPIGVVNCPACAGVITGVAVAASTAGNPAYTILVMTALGIGHTLALVGMSWLTVDAVKPVRMRVLQRVGGVVLLLTAAWYVRQAVWTGLTVGPTLP